MVDGHVEVEAGVAAVNGIDEFLELVEGGGGAVELGEGGVDCRSKIERKQSRICRVELTQKIQGRPTENV